VGQLTPIHARAVGQLQFAVEADRTFRLKLEQLLHKQHGSPLVRNRPEQVQIRLRGQIGQSGSVLPKHSAKYARRYLDCVTDVENGGDNGLPRRRRRPRCFAQ
jgi:hypothetical protein